MIIETDYCAVNCITCFSLRFCSRSCVGFDIDDSALCICQRNLTELDIDQVDLIKADVVHIENDEVLKRRFDTVIMNPPFGTKHNKGRCNEKGVQDYSDIFSKICHYLNIL